MIKGVSIMEQGYGILMIAFAVALWVYALCLSTGDYGFVLRGHATKPRDKKAYARYVGKIVAFVALGPFVSGLISLIGDFNIMIWPALIVLIGGTTGLIIIAVKKFDDGQGKED
jgi:hypothetical protein